MHNQPVRRFYRDIVRVDVRKELKREICEISLTRYLWNIGISSRLKSSRLEMRGKNGKRGGENVVILYPIVTCRVHSEHGVSFGVNAT